MADYETGLERGAANHQPLSPLGFLERAASVFPERTAIIHGERRIAYAEMFARCRRLAGALAACGIEPGDTVAAVAPNTPAMLEAHYGVPPCGAVLEHHQHPPRRGGHRLHPGSRSRPRP